MHQIESKSLYLRATIILTLLVCAFSVSAATDDDSGYRLGSGDRVKVTVYGHEDLSGEFDLDSRGNISLPLVQEVPASGLSAEQLEDAITGKLQPDYLKHPKVSVEILTYRPFYIIGEVKDPGGYPFVSGMTVINAVALAGGYTYRARTKALLIFRPDGEQQIEIKAEANTPVLPGDVIEVPERLF